MASKPLITYLFISFVFFPNVVLTQNDMVLKSIKVNHRLLPNRSQIEPITVYSNNNDLQFEFLPIKQDFVIYKYILTNYERDSTTIPYPIVRYMTLPWGIYNFEIVAEKYGKKIGKFNTTIMVQKAVSDSWWFYPMLALYALLLIAGGIYLFFMYNFRQKMKVQKLRNKIAADLHDEVGSTLNSIGISTKIIQKKIKEFAPELQSILNQMEVDSNETINTIRDTVWALNPENDSVQQLIEKIRIFAMQMFGNKDIELIFDNKINPKNTIKLGIDAQKNLYLIAKEAINNVVKHAEASLVKIIFSTKTDAIYFEIVDNGNGFDYLKAFEGNGLKNFQKRANESFMELKIESEIGNGTKIKLSLPLI